jgi:hypothetical protein
MLVFLKHGRRRRRGRAREKPLFLEERNSKHNQKTSKTETSVLSGPQAMMTDPMQQILKSSSQLPLSKTTVPTDPFSSSLLPLNKTAIISTPTRFR